VSFEEQPPAENGMDTVRFLMSANAGEELRAINKIASGGELARIMLAMKNVLSEQDRVGTMVFDEVDTGVSGRAAQKVAEKMADEIEALNLSSSYKCTEEHAQVSSHLTNKTELRMTQETVDAALTAFTEKTGIPMVVVVEEAEEVFGRTIQTRSIFLVLVSLVLLGLAAYSIVKTVRNKKNGQNGSGQQSRYNSYQNNNSQYH
jgi:hypothetical protein